MYPLEEIKNEIKKELSNATGKAVEKISLSTPFKEELGDLSTSICFQTAKEKNINPKQEAEQLIKKINRIKGVKEVKAVGGYINFYLDYKWLSEKTLIEAIKQDYGSSNYGEGKIIFIDYSSVNIAKPMHVGHLRSTIIGDSLYKLLEYIGFKCYSENYLGDWGLQFGKLLYAYKQWGSKEKLKQQPINHLHELYIKFHELEEKDKTLKLKAEEELSKLEKGDKENKKLWKLFRDLSLKKFNEVYMRLGISFDSFKGESHYSQFTSKVIQEALDKKVAVEEKPGTIIIPLEGYGLTNARLMENNRTLYITREITAAEKRKQEHDFYKALYVVSSAQSLHFQQLKKSLELLGYDWFDDCKHVKFGLFSLPEGKISTRKGNIIYLSDVLDKAVEKTKQIIEEKNSSFENKQHAAEIIGVGAVKFADLSQNRIKDVVFDFDKMISFEGDTSPYLQYAYVRCNSILEKNKKVNVEEVDFSRLIKKEEKQLIKKIAEFPKVVEKSALKYEPHLLANYLLELTHLFSSFYEKCKVAGNSERIFLVKAVANVLKIGLSLLGIDIIERM